MVQKCFVGLVLILAFMGCKNDFPKSYKISVEEVGVELNEYINDNNKFYEPYRMHLVFNIENNNDSTLIFTSTNRKYSNEKLAHGIFEIIIKKDTFSLYTNYEPFEIKGHSNVLLVSDFEDSAFLKALPREKLKGDLHELLISSKILYHPPYTHKSIEVKIPADLRLFFNVEGTVMDHFPK